MELRASPMPNTGYAFQAYHMDVHIRTDDIGTDIYWQGVYGKRYTHKTRQEHHFHL